MVQAPLARTRRSFIHSDGGPQRVHCSATAVDRRGTCRGQKLLLIIELQEAVVAITHKDLHRVIIVDAEDDNKPVGVVRYQC